MINGVFSVYDTKAKAYLQPFHAVNVAVASRMMADAVSQSDHMFNKHAADYVFFQVANFDDETGVFESLTPVNLGGLISFLPVTPNA